MDDHAPLIERAFALQPCEQSYRVEGIAGAVPEFIRGTYYLNGPARFSWGDFRYRHWLDGDGMVCALRFERGRVQFTNRFIRSAKFVAEQEAARPIFRTFGTRFPGDRLKRGVALESPVNVSVYPYAGRLLAFGEQGLPWELDPVTLETRGEFNFGGRLTDITPFAAHPKLDRSTGEMFNFGVAFSAEQPHLNFYRFDGQANLIHRKRLPLDLPCSLHDFGLSPRYAVFYLSPYILSMDALRDGKCLMESLNWQPERGSRLRIVSRDTGAEVAAILIGSRYCLHWINCFEQDGRLIADVVEFERPIYDQYQEIPNLFTDVGEAQPVRFIIDLEKRELAERRSLDYRLAPDFPSIDTRQAGKPYRHFWMLGISATGRRGRKFFDQLVHADWSAAQVSDIYQAPPAHYLGGEPVFVGDESDPEAGAIICQLFDARRAASAFVIFDAFHVARGPVATLQLQAPIPLAFHAAFERRAERPNGPANLGQIIAI